VRQHRVIFGDVREVLPTLEAESRWRLRHLPAARWLDRPPGRGDRARIAGSGERQKTTVAAGGEGHE